MAVFQLGEVPTGFVFNESGGLIHYRYGLLLPVPQPNQAYDPKIWGNAYFSLGPSWADVRLKVQTQGGTKWLPAEDRDVDQGNARYAKQLPQGPEDSRRVKKSSTAVVDDTPVGWLLEYVQP